MTTRWAVNMAADRNAGRVEGVEASDDPLLDVRAAVYLISGKGRRAAE